MFKVMLDFGAVVRKIAMVLSFSDPTLIHVIKYLIVNRVKNKFL